MSMRPEMITTEQVAEQIQALQQQKTHLDDQVKQLDHKIKLIENSIRENDVLKKKIHEQLAISYTHFQTEWKRKTEYFPEIRLNFLQRTLELLSPKK